MKRFASAGLVFALFSLAPGAFAQVADVKPAVPAATAPAVAAAVAPARPAARPADVASIDAIMAALYDVVSGPAGTRDWDRLRSLFIADGKMGVIGAKPGGGFGHRSMSVEDYIARSSKTFSEMGFFETEVARTSDAFGQLTHVFSTYEARKAPADKPFIRGINSLQLYNDGTRWWVISLLWRAEDDKLSLPEKYLKSH